MSHLFIITGASRGLGAALSSVLSEELSSPFKAEFVLLARDHDGMVDTQNVILQNQPTADIILHQIDLGALHTLEESLDEVFGNIKTPSSAQKKVYLFHNSGSLGKLDRVETLSLNDIQASIALNVVSFMALSARFLQHFKDAQYGRLSVSMIHGEGTGGWCLCTLKRLEGLPKLVSGASLVGNQPAQPRS